MKPYLAKRVHFAYLQLPDIENSEDLMTVSYLLDVVSQAGFNTTLRTSTTSAGTPSGIVSLT